MAKHDKVCLYLSCSFKVNSFIVIIPIFQLFVSQHFSPNTVSFEHLFGPFPGKLLRHYRLLRLITSAVLVIKHNETIEISLYGYIRFTFQCQ